MRLSTFAGPSSHIRSSRMQPALSARVPAMIAPPEPAMIAPPPSMQASPTRTLGDLSIGHTAVINAAPQLAVNEQRAIAGGRSGAVSGVAPQVIAPPAAVGASGMSTGAPGRVIALSVHPAA